ncbi:MAG: hypothetical protein KDI51_10275 [Xanthomonadales bacterium]|nr:hypothetical protein [Xanthomonadales bacterium]
MSAMTNDRPHAVSLWVAVLATISFSSVSLASDGLKGIDSSWQPVDFLRQSVCAMPSGIYTIEAPLRGWVQRDDVAELINLIDSTQPCSGVVLAVSSRLRVHSTLGDEAAFLVEGYRQGRYPPGLTSVGMDDGDRAALREWWRVESGATDD